MSALESAAICAHGCAKASACSGACQPIVRLNGKHCKWCAQGYERTGDDHWIVKSIRKPTIEVRACASINRAA